MSDLNQHPSDVLSRARGAITLRHSVGCFAILVGLMMSSAAVADEPSQGLSGREGDLQNDAIQKESPPTEAPAPINYYWLLGATLALGFGGYGSYRLLQRRREARYFQFEDIHFDDELLIDRLHGENALGAPRSIIRVEDPASPPKSGIVDDFLNHPEPVTNRVSLQDIARARAHFLAGKSAESSDGVAETSWPSGLKQRRALTEQSNFIEQYGLDRLVCSGCDRRYYSDAQFCYHDGLPLMQDTRQLAQISARLKVCKSCGWESGLDVAHPASCPEDEDSWTEIDVADATPVVPMIPMMICTQCGKFGAPGQTHCSVEAHLLSPLLDTRHPELPTRGFGPRRKICTECGAAHGPAANYCSQDGAELVALN